jgi:hypothetical protein
MSGAIPRPHLSTNMEQQHHYDVSIGEGKSVKVMSAQDAVNLGKYIAELVSNYAVIKVQFGFLQGDIDKAKNLCKEMDKTINVSQAECRKLKAENERLREAGDAMAFQIEHQSELDDADWGVDTGAPERVKAWNAAKRMQS